MEKVQIVFVVVLLLLFSLLSLFVLPCFSSLILRLELLRKHKELRCYYGSFCNAAIFCTYPLDSPDLCSTVLHLPFIY
jgi:hypothetical protein